MKKYPADSAHRRARRLRQNMTEAEKRVWQILRSHHHQAITDELGSITPTQPSPIKGEG
jgi:Protein of unknown function (DUF559)